MEATERQEEVLWDQAQSLARMVDTWEKSAGGVTKFANVMELFACGDLYLSMWEMGKLGNEQEEVPLKLAWKDRTKRVESGNGLGSGSGNVDVEATLQ